MSSKSFSETVRVRVPEGFSAAIVDAARLHCVDVSSFVRMVLTDRLRDSGINPPDVAPRRRDRAA